MTEPVDPRSNPGPSYEPPTGPGHPGYPNQSPGHPNQSPGYPNQAPGANQPPGPYQGPGYPGGYAPAEPPPSGPPPNPPSGPTADDAWGGPAPYGSNPADQAPWNAYTQPPGPAYSEPADGTNDLGSVDGTENVGRGLLFAAGAIPIAAAVAAVIAGVGFIASIASFVLAALAVSLYGKGSGGVIRKGIPGIIGLIVVGVVVAFFAGFAVDLAQTYAAQGLTEQEFGTRGQFILANLFNTEVLTADARNIGLFLLFAALGTFGTLRRLASQHRAG